MSPYRIERDDGRSDAIAGRRFDSYDEAHALLERYYADLCCSDEREYYRIEAEVPLEQQQTSAPSQREPSAQP